MNVLKTFGQTEPPAPDFSGIDFDWDFIVTAITGAITSIGLPALVPLLTAAALMAAFGWVFRRGRSAVKLR